MADIAQRTIRPEPPSRPERVFELDTMGTVGDAARPLSIPERILQITAVRRLLVLAVLCIAWQAYASYLNNSLLFPTLTETMEALYDAVVNGPLVERTLTSLQILLTGYAAGLALAGIFTTLAVSTRVGTDFLSTLTAMFNPLPAIALLAARAVVVRARREEPRVRHHPFGAVGGRAQHPFGLHLGEPDACAWRDRTAACAGSPTWRSCWCRRHSRRSSPA